jgi:hypothetical protein
MHNEFGGGHHHHGAGTKRDGFSVASNATATTRSTCSSEESSGSRLRGSSSKSGGASSSSRRRAGAGPPRTTSSREGGGPPRTSSSREGGGSSSRSRDSSHSSAKSSFAGAADFGSSFGSSTFDGAAFADFSEPFGAAPAQAPAAAAVPRQRARRRASVAGGTPASLPVVAVADPVAAEPPTRRERAPLDRQRSRSGERSTASSTDSRRAGGRRTTTRRGSNGDSTGGGTGAALIRAKSSGDFLDFDANNNDSSDVLDMFGGYGGGGCSPTAAADYGYGDDNATHAGAQTVSEGMDYGYGDDDDAAQPKLPRAKLSRARRSSIGVTQFGGSSDAFLNNLCNTSTREFMSEKDVEKPKPKPTSGGTGGPSIHIAMPLAGESPVGAKVGIHGAGTPRRGGRRASLIGGMNVGVGLVTGSMNVGVGLVTNKLQGGGGAGEKLDDPDSGRKNKASFFKDRSGGGGDHKLKGGAPSAATRSKSAGDSSMSSYNPDRDRRQMMKD